MDWRPLTRKELQSTIERDSPTAQTSSASRLPDRSVRADDVESGTVWRRGRRVLGDCCRRPSCAWYNDIEDGFKVSTLPSPVGTGSRLGYGRSTGSIGAGTRALAPRRRSLEPFWPSAL